MIAVEAVDYMQERKDEHAQVIPLVEETLHVEKREVSTGKVRVRTLVDTVEEHARATLSEETVEVTRVPIGTVVDKAPSVRVDGDLTVVPVLEEVLFVEKRLVLAEEIHIRRRVKREDVEVPVSLRKQRAIIEPSPPDDVQTPDKDANT